jgi:hypothetical protein
MNAEMQEKIQQEIVKQALEKSISQQHRRQEELDTQDILDALEELTGLSRVDLDKIAIEVKRSYAHAQDSFLSIKSQIIIGSVLMLTFLCVPILPKWLL